jgi:hypothetical protein
MAAPAVGRAWVLLCLALAVHVIDEAATGFLNVYNPSVRAIRSQWPWLPLPVFDFYQWIVGLAVAVVGLLALYSVVRRGIPWARIVAYVFAVLMIANALGHTIGTIFGRTVGSVQFPRPMPGFYSSPFLFVAALYLLKQLRAHKPGKAS